MLTTLSLSHQGTHHLSKGSPPLPDESASLQISSTLQPLRRQRGVYTGAGGIGGGLAEAHLVDTARSRVEEQGPLPRSPRQSGPIYARSGSRSKVLQGASPHLQL
jgi:hypothetical protein